jgi:hypothetical protein
MEKFFGKSNYLGILVGTGLLVLGFFLLSRGPADNKLALNVAPFILTIAFVVVIPLSILLNRDKEGK